MMTRNQKARRLNQLLERVSINEGGVIGRALPTKLDVGIQRHLTFVRYYQQMKTLGYSKSESHELYCLERDLSA